MILANTEELHDQIDSLLERIRALEEALRTLQASVSTHPHPLLVNSMLDVPPLLPLPPMEASPIPTIHIPDDHPGPSSQEEEREVIDALGRSLIIYIPYGNNAK